LAGEEGRRMGGRKEREWEGWRGEKGALP